MEVHHPSPRNEHTTHFLGESRREVISSGNHVPTACIPCFIWQREEPQVNMYLHVLVDVACMKKGTRESDSFPAGTVKESGRSRLPPLCSPLPPCGGESRGRKHALGA